MSEKPAQGRARDAALALTVLGLRAGWRAGGVVVSVLRPVSAQCLRRWPCRPLAEAGAGYRRAVSAAVARQYQAAVRVVTADVADELDLPQLVRDALADTGDGVRSQARRADETVSGWVDRAMGRGDH